MSKNGVFKVIIFISGVILLGGIFDFIRRIEQVKDAVNRVGWSQIATGVIIVITVGVGINLGVRLLNFICDGWSLLISLCFAVYFLVLQLFLAIAPAATACHCTSFSEALMNIGDWSRVEYAFLLLAVNLVTMLCFRKFGSLAVNAI